MGTTPPRYYDPKMITTKVVKFIFIINIMIVLYRSVNTWIRVTSPLLVIQAHKSFIQIYLSLIRTWGCGTQSSFTRWIFCLLRVSLSNFLVVVNILLLRFLVFGRKILIIKLLFLRVILLILLHHNHLLKILFFK